jgi:DNA-binding transcriptional LysR family regulator
MPMATLHQLHCFLQVFEAGSLTGAAERMGYAQPSVSEQIKALERSVGTPLFTRVGRGVLPTSAAEEMRPHAERALAAADQAMRAARSVTELETGTIRFGMFGTSRLYASADLVADVLARYPGVRVELVGQNSADVMEDLRRGRIEAAMIAVPQVASEGMRVVPVARDELVYVSADPARLSTPVTAARLARASLVLTEPWPAQWTRPASSCDACCTREGSTRSPGSRWRTSRPRSSWSPAGTPTPLCPRARHGLWCRGSPRRPVGWRCVRARTTPSRSSTAATPR